MKNITHVIANSKLARAADVFEFYSTDNGEFEFGYTPFTITTWNQGKYDHEDPRNISWVFHELSHMLLHEYEHQKGFNGVRQHNIKNNFGWPRVNNLTNTYAAYNEGSVLGIQAILEMDNPEIVTPYDADEVYAIIKEHHKYPFTIEKYHETRWNMMKNLSPEYLYELLDSACTYVLENRDNAANPNS